LNNLCSDSTILRTLKANTYRCLFIHENTCRPLQREIEKVPLGCDCEERESKKKHSEQRRFLCEIKENTGRERAGYEMAVKVSGRRYL
jgi:hypothetical protein